MSNAKVLNDQENNHSTITFVAQRTQYTETACVIRSNCADLCSYVELVAEHVVGRDVQLSRTEMSCMTSEGMKRAVASYLIDH
jgi:hypothetical protein